MCAFVIKGCASNLIAYNYHAQKNCQITRIIEALGILPCHWQIIPTNGKQPLGCQWQQHPFTPKSLQHQLAKEGRVKVYGNNQSFYEVVPTGIALLCGQNSQEYLVAVDCDGQSAFDKIEQLDDRTSTFHCGIYFRAAQQSAVSVQSPKFYQKTPQI